MFAVKSSWLGVSLQFGFGVSFPSNYNFGIAPFGDSLVVLAYIPGDEVKEKEFSSSVPS